MPVTIDDGRLDFALRLIDSAKTRPHDMGPLRLNWRKTKEISPAGHAVLACLFDTFIEQGTSVVNFDIGKKFGSVAVIHNLKNIQSFSSLPAPEIHNFEDFHCFFRGHSAALDISFMERVQEKFGPQLPERVLFASKLIANELMQNTIDHSTAERYYIYAGLWKEEFHVGVLDMGITIPAKLEQKYRCASDLEYLELSFKKGVGTRRQRPGGLGLAYFFDLLKENEGKLTVISRRAEVRRYFKTRRAQKNLLKYPLPGTWCFARFFLETAR